jgi:hypothetical protein
MSLNAEISEMSDKIDLDAKWIEEFEKIDNNYKTFYAEDILNIKFQYVYVNKENNIDKVKKETVLLKTPNYISREELIGILKKNNKSNNASYTVLSILKYNIDIDPSDVVYYIKNNIKQCEQYEFLKLIKNIDAIPLNKSISMFQDLNDIIIIFYEKSINDKNDDRGACNHTKRIYIKTIRANKRRTYRKTA